VTAALDPDSPYSEALMMDGFEEALVGFGFQFTYAVAIYDRSRCIEVLVQQGMDEDGAEEYFEFNCQGAFVGPHTPVIMSLTVATPLPTCC
jgi:hypothetical protein